MTSKHTPGPWCWQDGRLIEVAHGGDVLAIDETGGDYGEPFITVSPTDARLIAEAPAMLEALREAEHVARRDGADGLADDIRAILARIDAA